jgi:hypothetical protein
MFVPASFSVVETAVPRAVFALFGKRPYVNVEGRERSDVQNSRAVEALLDYDFEQARVSRLAVEFFKSMYTFGTAVARIDHHRDSYDIKHPPTYTLDIDVDPETGDILNATPRRLNNLERITRFDGPRMTNVNIFDFFPDPQFTRLDDMRYVIEREESTMSRLRHDDQVHFQATGKHKYKNLSKVPAHRGGQMDDLGQAEDFRRDTAEVLRIGYGWGDERPQKEEETVILHHYWERDRYVVLANGSTVIRDGDNPYNDQRLPFVSAVCFPTLGEFYGQGLLNPIQYLQEELNTLRNIALDQGKLNLYGIWAIDENATLSDVDLAVYPGKTIYTEFQGGKPNIEQVFQSSLPPDWERLENRTQRDIQSTLAINDYMIGAGGGSAGTASEASMLNASARQQFLDQRKVFRVLGEQGVDYPEIGPEEIAGRFDFRPTGMPSQPNREVYRQQLMQLMAIAAGNPILAAQTKWDEVYKELWGMFDVQFPERFLLTAPPKQMSQRNENLVILAGEKVAVDPNENHQEHMQELMPIMADVLASRDPRVQEAFQDHVNGHQRYLQQMSKTPGQAQTPGGMSGAPGNQPNTAQQSTPTLPSMQANVMGGPGGPIG